MPSWLVGSLWAGLTAGTLFCALASIMTWARRQPLLAGAIYGVAVYAVMNLVVVPLSAFPTKLSLSPSALAIGLSVHIVCIGVPIALIAARLCERGEGAAPR